MTTVQLVSVVALTIVAMAAALGIFCRHFHDNWPQLLGLAGLATWAIARVLQITDMTDHRVPNQGAVMHVSLALYALGTAWKVWTHRPVDPPPAQPPYKIEAGELHHVGGGRS